MNEDKISRSPTTPEHQLAAGLQQTAKQATHAAQTEIEKLKGAAREQGSAAVEEIKTVAQSAAREAQEAGRDFVHEQKENLFVVGLAAARFFNASRTKPRRAGPPEPVGRHPDCQGPGHAEKRTSYSNQNR